MIKIMLRFVNNMAATCQLITEGWSLIESNSYIGAFHLLWEVRIYDFPVRNVNSNAPEVEFPTWKVGGTSPAPTSKSKMADLCVNNSESCINILFILSYCGQWACAVLDCHAME